MASMTEEVPMEGSSLLGFFHFKLMVLPLIDSTTGAPSGGSGMISGEGLQREINTKYVQLLQLK